MNNFLDSLAKKFGYELIYNHQHPNDPLTNDCAKAGTTIFIGEYKDDELKLISFFHEHGHGLVSQEFKKKWNYNTLMIEIEAWNLGLESARSMNYLFSDKAIEWAYVEKAMSYCGHDERECANWKEEVEPRLWKTKIN